MTDHEATFGVGDKVSVSDPKFPGVWIVRSRGPVNTVLDPDGGGRGLRVPHYMLRAPDAAAVPAAPRVIYHAGEFVRVAHGRFAGLYVVIKDDGRDKVNLARPGGDGGRYVRMPRGGVVRVEVAEILKDGVAL
jgi:hypothetical protein